MPTNRHTASPTREDYRHLKQRLEQGIVQELHLPEPPCSLEPDSDWPAPRILIGSQSGRWEVLDESRLENTRRVATDLQSIRALGERMPFIQWVICASTGIKMLLPLWIQYRDRWRPYFDGMIGYPRRYADEMWTAEQIEQILHLPERVLQALPRWIESISHSEQPFDLGIDVHEIAGQRRDELIGQLMMLDTPGAAAERMAGRHEHLGFITQLEFADQYLSSLFMLAEAMELGTQGAEHAFLARSRTTACLYRLGTAVVHWTQYQILLCERQSHATDYSPGILQDASQPPHLAVQERVAQRFFDRWWELCRCRLAFADASSATLEEPTPGNHTHESGEGIWFTSDHHFFHKNIIRYTERPFPFVATMNEEMLRRWNERVKPDDLVYYVGDLIFVYDDQWDSAFRFLDRLNGRIVMIEGNHDIEQNGKRVSRPLQRHPKIIEWHSSKGDGLSVQVEGVKLLLNHYPAGIWKGKEDGVAHLYGHNHATEVKPGWMLRLNVGVDAHDFRPWSWSEVKDFLSQCKDWEKFYKSPPPTPWGDLDQSALGGPSHIEKPGHVRLETIVNHGSVRILAWIGETKVGDISASRSDYIRDAYRTTCIEVEPPFRGQGIGQTLYLAMLDLVGRLHPDWLFGMSDEARRTWSRLDGAITPEGSRVRAIVPASVDPPTVKPGVDGDPDEWIFTLPEDAYGDDLEPTSKIRAVLPTVVLEPTGDERKTNAEDALAVFTVMELAGDEEPNEVGVLLSPDDPERHFPRDYERQLSKLKHPTPRRVNPLDIVHPRGMVYGKTPPPTNQDELVDLLTGASEIMLLRAMLTAWDIGKHPPYHSDPALSAHIETMLHEIQRMVDTHEHLRIEYHSAARAVERAYHADQQGMPLSVDQETLLLAHMLLWVAERIDLWVIPDEPGEPLEKPTPIGGDELTFAASVINTLAPRNPGFYAHWWDEFRRRIPFEDALTATLEGPDPPIYYQMLERLNYPESHRQDVPGLLFQLSSGSLRLTPEEVQATILSLSPTTMAYAALVALSMLHEEVLAHYDMNTPTSAWCILDHAMERLPRLFQQVLNGTPIEGQLARMFGNVRWASNPAYPDQLQVGNAIAWTMELLTPLNPGAHPLPSRMAEHLWQAVHSAAEAYAILASSQGVQTAFYGRWWELVSQRLAFMNVRNVTLEGPDDDRTSHEEAIIVRNEATPQGQQLIADVMEYFGKSREEARRALLRPSTWLPEIEMRKAASKQHQQQTIIDTLWDASWILERRLLAEPSDTTEAVAVRFAEVLRDRRGRTRRSPIKEQRNRLHPETGHEEILWRIGTEWYRSLREPADRTGKQLVNFYRLPHAEEAADAPTVQGADPSSETIASHAAGKQSARVGRLHDNESPDLIISINVKREHRDEWKVVLGYTIAGKRRSETINFVGLYSSTPIHEVIRRVQDYLDAGGEKGRFRAEYEAPVQKAPPQPPSPMDAVKQKLKQLEKVRYKTWHDEREIAHLKAILASKPKKWAVGMGVRWHVTHDQWNRGFRIVEVRPEERKAVIVQVADTGLTRTGGNDPIDRRGQVVWLADLKRDKQYDAPETMQGMEDEQLKKITPLPGRELGPMDAPPYITPAEGRTRISPEWRPGAEGPQLRVPGYEYLGHEAFRCDGSTGRDAADTQALARCGNVANRVAVYRHLDFHDALVSAGVAMDEAGRHPASEFVLIPPGAFEMGSELDTTMQPIHPVRIGYSLLIARTPLVQAVWMAFSTGTFSGAGYNPSYFGPQSRLIPVPHRWREMPVEQVSWPDATEWCAKLGLRLPSEAEWEYACRAGTTTRYGFGDDETALGRYSWFGSNSNHQTHPVAQLLPNAFGLFDMHGNVWEWCQDTYQGSYVGAPTDGSAWEVAGASNRVNRGGSFYNYANWCRSANRGRSSPGLRFHFLGFRPIQAVSPRDWSFREYYGETEERPPGITSQGRSIRQENESLSSHSTLDAQTTTIEGPLPEDEKQAKIDAMALLGPEFRLPDEVPQKVIINPATMNDADQQAWSRYGVGLPEAGPYHRLMVYRKFPTIDEAIHFYRYIKNTSFRFEQDKKMGFTGPVLEVGYLKQLDLPLHTAKRSGMFLEFCKVGYVFPKQHTFEVRSSYGGDCVNSRVEWLDEYEPFDQSSPFARAMIRHLRNTSDWTSWQSIFSDDRMTDTSLDPPQAHHFGEWWSKEWERLRTPGQKHEHVYHITYPSQIAAIRDSGKLLAFRGFSRLTYCPEQMVGNTFGASRFIRIPIKDLPPLIDVHYDAAFVHKHPEIAETISEYLWDIDRDRLDDDAYVHAVAAEIARYMRECETVVPGDLILPPSTEWGIPALGVMGKLFASDEET